MKLHWLLSMLFLMAKFEDASALRCYSCENENGDCLEGEGDCEDELCWSSSCVSKDGTVLSTSRGCTNRRPDKPINCSRTDLSDQICEICQCDHVDHCNGMQAKRLLAGAAVRVVATPEVVTTTKAPAKTHIPSTPKMATSPPKIATTTKIKSEAPMVTAPPVRKAARVRPTTTATAKLINTGSTAKKADPILVQQFDPVVELSRHPDESSWGGQSDKSIDRFETHPWMARIQEEIRLAVQEGQQKQPKWHEEKNEEEDEETDPRANQEWEIRRTDPRQSHGWKSGGLLGFLVMPVIVREA